jgi:purine-cytosine permease-like protein
MRYVIAFGLGGVGVVLLGLGLYVLPDGLPSIIALGLALVCLLLAIAAFWLIEVFDLFGAARSISQIMNPKKPK